MVYVPYRGAAPAGVDLAAGRIDFFFVSYSSLLPFLQAGKAAEEQPGNQQADPDHEAEQADDVDGGELADALLPQLPEVGQNADRKGRQDEEDHPVPVGFADRVRGLSGQ